MAYSNSEKANAYKREWRKKNRVRLLKEAQKWRDSNRDKIHSYDKKWRSEKPKEYFRYADCVCEKCDKGFIGWRKSNRFCSRKCMGLVWSKPYKNKYLNTSINYKRIPDHRLVMEKVIGRKLKSSEVVHHINFNKRDNRPENLMLFKSNSDHIKHHRKIRREQKL